MNRFRWPLLGSVFALLLVGCGDDAANTSTGDGPALFGRSFLSESVLRDGEPVDLVDDTRIALSFDDERVGVNVGCNQLNGNVTVENDRLLIEMITSTEMGCSSDLHAQDDWIVQFLAANPTWHLDEPHLTLTADNQEITFVDRKVAEPDRALEGTRWVLDTLIDGDSASSVPLDTDPELRLEDGEARGTTGCNHLSGEYLVDGDRVRLNLIRTNMFCADAAPVEEAFEAVTGKNVDFTIDGDRLTLLAPDGRGLGFHAVGS